MVGRFAKSLLFGGCHDARLRHACRWFFEALVPWKKTGLVFARGPEIIGIKSNDNSVLSKYGRGQESQLYGTVTVKKGGVEKKSHRHVNRSARYWQAIPFARKLAYATHAKYFDGGGVRLMFGSSVALAGTGLRRSEQRPAVSHP